MGHVLKIGVTSPIQNLDPRQAVDFVNLLAFCQVFETSFLSTRGAGPDPLLFEGGLRDLSDGAGEIFRGRPRSDVRFSDGSLLEVDRLVSVLGGSEGLAKSAEVRAEGDDVVFALQRPNPGFAAVLASPGTAIYRVAGGQVLGTGPYRVVDSDPEATRLEANPHYREPVGIEAIEFRVFPRLPDGTSPELLAAVESGEIHFTSFLGRQEISALQGVRKAIEPGLSAAYLYFNTRRPAFRDRRLRETLALAIDPFAIAGLFYDRPLPFVSRSLLPEGIDKVPWSHRHDPLAAREGLASLGVSFEAPLRLLTVWGPRPYLPAPRLAAEEVARQLASVGVPVEVDPPTDLQSFCARVAEGDYDLAISGWNPDNADPSQFLQSLLGSRRVPRIASDVLGSCNLAAVEDPEIDLAILAYRKSPTDGTRRALSDRVRSESPLVPLVEGPYVTVHSWRLKNYPASFFGQPRFATMRLADPR